MGESLLHLVFGGEVKDPRGLDYKDDKTLDVVGIFPNYAEALEAWRAVSMKHVDEANVKYVIVHLHRLLEPRDEGGG